MPDTGSVVTVAIAGALASKPFNGGEAWVRMSWVEAFRRLGCAVIFIEEVPRVEPVGVDWFQSVTSSFGLSDRAWLVDRTGRVVVGPSPADLPDRLGEADIVINISGNLRCLHLVGRPRLRVYLDLDPGFTQLWHVNQIGDLRLEAHDAHLTIGENIGQECCTIPTGGFGWIPTRQPVVLDRWPMTEFATPPRFTTVTTWRGPYGAVEGNGEVYRGKHQQFRRVATLPGWVEQEFEIATTFNEADIGDRLMLESEGWRITPATDVAGSTAGFQRFIQDSWAEFSVAHGVYVETNSGWFSDRSTRYLASGRPVLIQDTGWARSHDISEGAVTFRDVEGAVSGAGEIAGAYPRHAQAARVLAETFFDSDNVARNVLTRLQLIGN